MTRPSSLRTLAVGPRSPLSAILAVLALIVATPTAHTGAAPADEAPADEAQPDAAGDAPDRKAQMAAMQRIASGTTVTVTDETSRDVDIIPNALFRFHDPARNQSDGTIWGFGTTGRPAALLTLTLHPRTEGPPGWLYELNSLAAGPVAAKLRDQPLPWSTRKS